MTFKCNNCDTTYEELTEMKEVQVTEGMREYLCINCDSEESLATLKYPTD